MKLNIGCGDKRIPGYFGIDIVQRAGVDLIAPAHAIPLDAACADEVLAVHVIEHIYSWEAPAVLIEWARLLRPGGLLVLELPDVLKCARNLLAGTTDQLSMWGLYGDDRARDPHMMHRTGWTFRTLAPVVAKAGFFKVREGTTQFHGKGRGVRDFRLEATKL